MVYRQIALYGIQSVLYAIQTDCIVCYTGKIYCMLYRQIVLYVIQAYHIVCYTGTSKNEKKVSSVHKLTEHMHVLCLQIKTELRTLEVN